MTLGGLHWSTGLEFGHPWYRAVAFHTMSRGAEHNNGSQQQLLGRLGLKNLIRESFRCILFYEGTIVIVRMHHRQRLFRVG